MTTKRKNRLVVLMQILNKYPNFQEVKNVIEELNKILKDEETFNYCLPDGYNDIEEGIESDNALNCIYDALDALEEIEKLQNKEEIEECFETAICCIKDILNYGKEV